VPRIPRVGGYGRAEAGWGPIPESPLSNMQGSEADAAAKHTFGSD